MQLFLSLKQQCLTRFVFYDQSIALHRNFFRRNRRNISRELAAMAGPEFQWLCRRDGIAEDMERHGKCGLENADARPEWFDPNCMGEIGFREFTRRAKEFEFNLSGSVQRESSMAKDGRIRRQIQRQQ
jgi:hypothetical protein